MYRLTSNRFEESQHNVNFRKFVYFKVHKPMDPFDEEIVSLRLRPRAISSKTERNSLLSMESELSCSHTECA